MTTELPELPEVPDRIRVALIDDEHLVRAGLRLMLQGRAGIEIVAEAADGVQGVREVETTPCDVVLMDIRMPRRDGVAATALITQLPDAPRVIALTTFDSDDLIVAALRAGASGFLLKDTPPAELLRAVQAAAMGRLQFSPAVLDRLVDAAVSHRPTPEDAVARELLATLTDRERQVADGVARGLSNAEIGVALHLSLATVKTHLSHVFDKLGTQNRVQVALMVRDAGRP